MVTWDEIHAHFSSIDERIPPFECYVNEENAPYYDGTLLLFRLSDGIEIPDTTRGFSGAPGGVSRGGFLLPPIVFPAEPIDLSEGKVQCGKKGALVDSDSSSDSHEDIEEDDTHKLRGLVQAAHKGQTTFAEIRGDYPCEGQFQEVIFRKGFRNGAPSNIMDPLQAASAQLKQLGIYYRGAGMPQSCRWTTAELPQ
jgi:hypothetical protein